MLYKSSGTLTYGPGIRAAITIDPEIAKYYRKLTPKYCDVKSPMYAPHITVVRTGIENPPNQTVWGKYEGYIVEFDYDSEVRTDGTYFYLRAWSDRIGDIRVELGLPRYRFNDLEYSAYHITIGNCKT